MDNKIDWPWSCIFIPLFVWKGIAALGAIIGCLVWIRYPHTRMEDSYSHFKAMLISMSLHCIILLFDLLALDKLTTERHLWVLVFIPLIFGSVASVGACVWAVKNERSFELELFCAVNALQFVFLPLKLDGFVTWSWEIVFVPLWIVLCLSLVGVLYSIIFCAILLKTQEVSTMQKRSAIHSAVGNCLTVLPILVFQVLLADKLDGDLEWDFLLVCTPLLFALFTLILLSFTAKGGNKWWFGIRKNFATFILEVFPCLQEYGNISISMHNNDNNGQSMPLETSDFEFDKYDKKSRKALSKKQDLTKPVVPITSIDMPD